MPFPFSFWKSAAGVLATFTDTFVRANSNPMSLTASDGHAWTLQPGASAGGMKIVSNTAYGQTAAVVNMGRISTPTFTNNHSCSVTVSTFPNAYGGPAVHIQGTSDAAHYHARLNNLTTTILVNKVSSALSETLLLTISGLSLVAGDIIKLKATGTSTVVLVVYVNGVQVGTISDASTPLNGGQPGFFSYDNTMPITLVTATDE